MRETILFVDDDPVILKFYKDYFEREFQVDTALSGAAALERIQRGEPIAVLVSDMKMPGMNGIELLLKVKEVSPDTVRLMLSADTERPTTMEAINRSHIYQFLDKPCAPEMMQLALEAALKQYQMTIAERELLEKTLSGSIKMLTEILSVIDPHAFGQGQKVREYVQVIAVKLRCPDIWELEVAAMLSGLGYVTIPPYTLQRLHSGADLSPAEQNMLDRLPEFGRKLLSHIPRLEKVAELVHLQHKNFDGSGFPANELRGEYIPLGARILRLLVDMVQFESEGLTKAEALAKLQERSGIYDARVSMLPASVS
jgi:response regulator RpfG family c-di-GMP phosphodiesterase